MTTLRVTMQVARLLIVAGFLTTLSACQKGPDLSAVHNLVTEDVKSSLEPHLGSVKVSVEKYALGETFTKKDAFGDRTYFPCKAIYTTVDSRGAVNKDCVWVGSLTKDEFGKWIAIPLRLSTSR